MIIIKYGSQNRSAAVQAVRASLDSATGKATEAMSGVPFSELEHGTEEAESEIEDKEEVNQDV